MNRHKFRARITALLWAVYQAFVLAAVWDGGSVYGLETPRA